MIGQLHLQRDVFQQAVSLLKMCFNKFFSWSDPVSATLSFPAVVNDAWIQALCLVPLRTGTVGDVMQGAESPKLQRDPRAMVVMGYFLVLLVLLEGLLPDRKKPGLRGNSSEHAVDTAKGVDTQPHPPRPATPVGYDWHRFSTDTGESESESDSEIDDSLGCHCGNETLGQLDRDRLGQQGVRARAEPPPGWWISGIGKQEIMVIAQYLHDLDHQEQEIGISHNHGCSYAEAMGSTSGGDIGRWGKWIEWPLEMLRLSEDKEWLKELYESK